MNREPEWTAQNMNRKKGDTTFDVCGWCEHRGCGSYKYDTMLSGSCELLKSYRNDVEFDTPCRIKNLGKTDIESLIRSKKYDLENKHNAIKELHSEIKTLETIKAKAVKKPALPDSRIDDYKLGEVVYVFIDKDIKWARGIVVPGYRSGDGCVSYVLDDYPDSKKGWGCGVSTPCILKEWEYKYFKSNMADFKIWLAAADVVYNGNKLDMPAYLQGMEKA